MLQTDIEDNAHLGQHPENERRRAETAGIAAERLQSIVSRIERLEEEKKALSEDIKDIYVEAKGAGFDVKALRKLIAARKMEAQERAELEEILSLYMRAVGM